MPECFVIMPLTTTPEMASRYGGDPDHFAHVLDHLFVPAIERADFTPKKPVAEGADLIHAEIVRNLETADLVLCDISALNANVFFEFGIRTALDRPICLVRDEHTKLPFDVGGINCHEYASSLVPWDLTKEVDRLAEHVGKAAERSAGHNALWRHFGLTHRGTEAIRAVPDQGLGSALQLLADDMASLRREVRANSHLGVRTRDELNLRGFLQEATALVHSEDREIHGHSFRDEDDMVVLDLDPPGKPSPELVTRLSAVARAYGLRVGFVV